MQALNCPRCGRLFTKKVASVCRRCEKDEEEQFAKLREFIESEPYANINEITDATGVPTKRILQYIREGRLIMSAGLSGELRCAQCGIAIEEGSFCKPCSLKIAQDLASALLPADIPNEEPKAKETKQRDDRRGVGFHTRNIKDQSRE